MENFEIFWDLFNPDPEFNNRQRACRVLWEQKSEQQRQILSYTDYYNRYGTTEEKDGWVRTFLPEQQKTIYVKQ